MSLMLTVSPLAANDSTSGMPTWPAPPTTVTSAVLAVAARVAPGHGRQYSTLLSEGQHGLAERRMKHGANKALSTVIRPLKEAASILDARASGPAIPD